MTYRQLWTGVIAAVVVTLGGQIVGPRFTVAFFVVMALLGVAGSIASARMRARLVRWLSMHGADAQERALVHMEHVALRPQIAAELGRAQPRVPLRGGRELFRYPAE